MPDRHYDGVILADKWGKTYLCSNCLLAYADLGEDCLSEVKDMQFGRYFLHDLEPHWNHRAIWAAMYQHAKPWQFDLSKLSNFELRDSLIKMFAADEMRIWQLTEGWGQPPEDNGIGEGGLAPETGGGGSTPAPATRTAKPGGGAAPEETTTAKAATHEAKRAPNPPKSRPSKTSDGQEIVYFDKSDIKCKEMWGGQAYEFFIDGPEGPLEFAEANVDSDNSNIEFYINNNFNRGFVLKANGFSMTNEVLQRSVKQYEESNGAPPVFLNGIIIKKNLQNFQKEFVNLRELQTGSSEVDIANEAVKKISFGAERTKIGYSDINVELKKFGNVEIDGVAHENVPISVKITAQKPLKNT